MEPRKQSPNTNGMPSTFDAKTTQPAWFDDHKASGWERVKEAFRRDWEQTKADFSKTSGRDLNQGVGDTVKQASGSEPVPPLSVRTHPATNKEALQAHDKLIDESKKTAKEVAGAKDDIAHERAKLDERTREVRDDLVKKQAKAMEEETKEKAAAREALAKQQMKTNEKIAEANAKAHEDISDAKKKANEKIADAQRSAGASMGKAHEKMEGAIVEREEARDEWVQAEREASYGYAARTQYPQYSEWNTELESTLRGEWSQLNSGRSWDDARAGVRRGWDFSKPQKH